MQSGASANHCKQTLQRGEALQVSVEDGPAKKKIGTSALTFHVHQSGLVQLFQMMGDGRRTDNFVFLQRAAC